MQRTTPPNEVIVVGVLGFGGLRQVLETGPTSRKIAAIAPKHCEKIFMLILLSSDLMTRLALSAFRHTPE